MGAQSSTPRTVHLENDIPIGVIDVSDDVVQRLKGMNAQGLLQSKYEKNNLKNTASDWRLCNRICCAS